MVQASRSSIVTECGLVTFGLLYTLLQHIRREVWHRLAWSTSHEERSLAQTVAWSTAHDERSLAQLVSGSFHTAARDRLWCEAKVRKTIISWNKVSQVRLNAKTSFHDNCCKETYWLNE